MGKVKCFECKEELEKEGAECIDASKTEKRLNRYFHKECLGMYQQKKAKEEEKKRDWAKWDELYQYVKREIFQYEEKQSLSKHMTNRLLGLRSGAYAPRKNKKVILSDEGYPYEVILVTFKTKKVDILNAIYDNSKFQDEQHKENYVMTIISNSINDVYLKMKQKEESNKRTENIDFKEMVYESEFKNKANIKENKVANKLKHLF